jgi:DUF971 family protein
MDTLTPTDARMVHDGLLAIAWSDGLVLEYPLDFLRASCPCAGCVDEWTGEVRVKIEMFPGISLKSLQQVGNYAFNVGFTDGHDTGLFTYVRLRKLGRPSSVTFPAPE